MYCRSARALLICSLAFLAACSRDSRHTAPRLAVLRFENLSADPSLDWMGRAFSEILSGELEGSTQLGVIQLPARRAFEAMLGARSASPGISAGSTAALVAGANGMVYGHFSVAGGVLRASAIQEDLATHQMVKAVQAGGPAGEGIFPVADALARQLGETHPFGTRNPQALRDYAAALESPDAGTAAGDFAQATAADPDFGRAYVLWLDGALARRDRAEAERVIGLAQAHLARFPEIDRAAVNLGAAALRGDYGAQTEALRTLARLDPADPDRHRTLAERLMSVRDYDGAIVEFRRALTLRPDDIAALNSMGYAAAFSGDLPTAIRVLRGYEELRPQEPNPLDSLGDAHFALGRFAEAEQFYLAAQAKSPAFLNGGEVLKAAQARLMTGDIPGAGGLFQRYLKERQAARDPSAPYHAAAWLWATGQRRAAVAGMERLVGSDPRASAQAAVWLLALGERARAAAHARQAVAEAIPATSAVAALAAYLAQPEDFPAPSQSPLKEYAQAYALLFARQFQPAAGILRQLYGYPTGDLDDGLAVLLAWAYQQTGEWQKAEPLLRLTPLPQASGMPVFSALYFPRVFYLRGAVLDREGHHAEAAAYFKLFHALSGPDATIWAEP